MHRRLPLCVFAITLSACHHSGERLSDSLDLAHRGMAAVAAHGNSARRHIHSALPYASDVGQAHLSAALDEQWMALESLKQIDRALTNVQRGMVRMQTAAADADARVQRLENRWYVRWGRRIERAFWIITIGWLVMGVASILLGLGNPLGWGMRLSREIVRLIPLMNPFTWVRDALLRRKN
jgi:hypothetical protein